jgi:hypothetical protein
VSAKLTLDDIADLRAYERERDEFRARIIELKKRRRVGIGPFITVVFENRDTIRFQIQEMARVEKLISDESIEGELRAYNPLIPEPGELALTMFIELTSELALRDWLPRLVGIERTLELRLGTGDDRIVVPCIPDAEHAEHLTREETTSSVHYLHFQLDEDQIGALAHGPVALALTHPEYDHEVELRAATVEELLTDLRR